MTRMSATRAPIWGAIGLAALMKGQQGDHEGPPLGVGDGGHETLHGQSHGAGLLARREIRRDGHLALGLPHLDAKPDQVGATYIFECREQGRVVEHDCRHPDHRQHGDQADADKLPTSCAGYGAPQTHAQGHRQGHAHTGVTETKRTWE